MARRASSLWLSLSLCLVAYAVVALGGCADAIPPINRVQPQVIEKSAFEGEWYFQQTVIDHPHTIAWTIVGETSRMERVVFEITEEQLIVRRAYDWIDGGEGPGVSGAGESGAPIAIFGIEGHFDIRRDYNPVTGEQVNVVLENDQDLPWYNRRFMRVDWSKNLITDAEFLIFARLYDGVEAESVSYYVEDPEDPDFPVFAHDDEGALDYFDVTNRLLVQPTTIDYGDGWGPEPVCWLLYQTHTDCAPAEVAVRNSFMRAGGDDYQPNDYSGDRQERFGYFVTERAGYDEEYGVVEPARSFFANRHDIWEDAYQRDADGGLVPCAEDAECGAGGACDDGIVRGGVSETPACTLPYGDRVVRPIPYHVSEGFPEDLMEDARWVGQQWNATFVETIASLRENECLATGGDAASCAGERTRDDGQTAFVICDNPVTEEDHSACGEPGTVARVGDIRYSLLGWEPEPGFGIPLGFGPANIDPETGEIITATAWVYGAGVEQLASYGRDIIALINGDLPPTDLIAGENVERWVASMSGRERSSSRTADRHVVGVDGADARDINAAMGLDRLGDPVRRRARPGPRSRGQMVEHMRAAQQEVLRGSALQHDDGRAQARLQTLRDTGLEALMTGPQMRFAAGLDPATPLDDHALDLASPLRQMSGAHMRNVARERRRLGAHRCLLRAEDFSDQGLIGLAQAVSDAVESGDGTIEWYGQSYDLRADGGGIDYDAVRDMLRHPIFASTAAHEIGHTLGLRHNFSGSYDSLNYAPRYWELRDDGRMAPRAYDPMTPAEIDGRIREYQYSTVMDYGNNFLSTDAHGLGHYDFAAIKMGYGDLVEVFEDAADPNELAWVHFSQLFGWPVAIDSQSWEDGGTVRAYPYTEIPALAGGIAGLEQRADVPYTSLGPDALLGAEGIDTPLTDPDGRPAVPYRFCSDEIADLVTDCTVYDAGADQYEVIQSILDTYWNYYVFNNYRRERLGFDVEDVYGRLYYNYFSKLLYQNQDYVFNRLFMDEIFSGDPSYDDFYERVDGMGAYTTGIGAAFNMLSRVIAVPEPGNYVEYDIGGGESAFFLDEFYEPELSVPVVDGRYLETTWNFDEGYYWFDQLERAGYYYDKILAIETLTDPQAFFVGKDEAADIRGFAVSFHTTFPDATNGLIGSMLSEDWVGYGARQAGDGTMVYPTPDELTERSAAGVPIDPNAGYAVQLFAAIYGVAYIPLSYDRVFMEKARIWVVGGAEEITIPPGETVTFVDPFTSVTYAASSYLDGAMETGIGARMLQHAAQLEADGDYYGLDLFMDNIQLMRSLNWEYGFGYY